jgi:hypothetical protein
LNMYFVEAWEAEFKAWVAKLQQHREMQQEDYYMRKALRESNLKNLKHVQGDTND